MGVNGKVGCVFDGVGEHLYIGSRTVFSGPLPALPLVSR